ncbi:hypothetical protein KKA14_21380 [bacterium]|nr:hypothetical protein [bacterium]
MMFHSQPILELFSTSCHSLSLRGSYSDCGNPRIRSRNLEIAIVAEAPSMTGVIRFIANILPGTGINTLNDNDLRFPCV